MTLAQDLRLYAVRYRWAFCELVLDQKLQVANWLIGNGREVDDPAVYDRKTKEAEELFGSIQGMYLYLVKRYGSGELVLDSLKTIVRIHKQPSKRLAIQRAV